MPSGIAKRSIHSLGMLELFFGVLLIIDFLEYVVDACLPVIIASTSEPKRKAASRSPYCVCGWMRFFNSVRSELETSLRR